MVRSPITPVQREITRRVRARLAVATAEEIDRLASLASVIADDPRRPPADRMLGTVVARLIGDRILADVALEAGHEHRPVGDETTWAGLSLSLPFVASRNPDGRA